MKKLVSIFTLIAMLMTNTSVFAGEATGSVSTGAQTGVEGVVITLPVESPAAGNYTSTQSVSLSASGSQYMCYSTNNATPTCDWANLGCGTGTKYSSAFSVAANATVKAVSCYQGAQSSTVANFTYTIGTGQETASTPSNTAASTPTDSGGGAFTSTVTISSATTVTGAADLSSAVTTGGADTGDSVTIAGNSLTVQSSADNANKVVIPAGSTITVASGTWTGVVNPPVSVTSESDATTALGKSPTLSVQMGDPNVKLDFGSTVANQPTATIKLTGTTCSSSGYTVVRKSAGDSSYSASGVSSVTATQSGLDCLVTFKTQYMSKFSLASNTSSSGGSGGGGGGGSSAPDTTTPYTLSAIESDSAISLNRPLDLSKTQGVLTRPVEITEYSQKHSISLKKGTKISYENGSMFTGIITVPTNVSRTSRPGLPEKYQLIRMISVGDKEGKSLKLSESARLIISTSFSKKVDPIRVKVYTYNETKQQFEITGGILSDDQKSVMVDVNHFSFYAVIYAETEEASQVSEVSVATPEKAETTQTTENVSETSFKDLNKHWAKEYVDILAKEGVVKGRSAGKYEPEGVISRAELVTIIARAFKLETPKTSVVFADVPQDAWFASSVQAAAAAGLVKGNEKDGKTYFRPSDSVTRAEAMKVLLLAAGVKATTTDASFDDVKASDWFASYVAYAAQKGIVKGLAPRKFDPAGILTRGQIAKIIVLLRQAKQ